MQNDRPRTGVVYDCWKAIKKTFRRVLRLSLNAVVQRKYQRQSTLYRDRNISAFWSSLRRHKHNSDTCSTLKAGDFAEHYEGVMQNPTPYTVSQQAIADSVNKHYSDLSSRPAFNCQVDPETVRKMILSLPKNKSAGCDGVTSEHLIHGLCDVLCKKLACLYTMILSWGVVPNVFSLGIIVPVLKKSTLDPNCSNNYRPITISSVHTKLVEGLIIPTDQSNDNQFGFKKGSGVDFGCALLHDIACIVNESNSPLFVCALDAEKCFDSIWHDGLFFKLYDKIP